MKVSIVIAILNSHEIVRRQILYFQKMNLPGDVEFVFVDDGSKPKLFPLDYDGPTLKNLTVHETNDFRPWTQPIARNKGAEIAKGEYLICTDIDHILSKDLIDGCSGYDVIHFKRELGVLDENGIFTQDWDVLKQWGCKRGRLRVSAHGNSYGIRRELFLELGGSRQKDRYPNRDEIPLKQKVKALSRAGKISVIPDADRPTIYVIPNGRFCGDIDYNPFGYFHSLSRKNVTA